MSLSRLLQKIDLPIHPPFAAPADCIGELDACVCIRVGSAAVDLKNTHQLSLTRAAGSASKRSSCPSRLTVKGLAEQKDAAHKAPLDYLRDAAKVSTSLSAHIMDVNSRSLI